MKKRIFKNLYYIIKYNWMTLILFELFYKGLILVGMAPFIKYMLNTTMKSANVNYLTTDNIIKIVTNPVSIILILLIILCMAFYIFFELTAMVICFDKSIRFSSIGLIELIKKSFEKSIKVINLKNILLIAFVIIIIPLTNVVLTSGFIEKIKIPEYIAEYIYSNKILNLVYMIFTLGIYFLAIRWIFSIHEITLNTDSFKVATKNSVSLTKGKRFKIFIYSIVLIISTAIVGIIILFLIVILIGLGIKYYIGNSDYAKVMFVNKISIIIQYSVFIASIIHFIINIGFLSVLYYEYNDEYKYDLKKLTLKKHNKHFKRNIFKLAIIILGICIESYSFPFNNQDLLNMEFLYNTTAIAHRAASTIAPENTISALKEAIISKAEYAEMDVQQTKDEELIIMHDSNFKRTTGVNKNVWEVNYDEVKNYDAGSYFSETFKGEKIPTFDEVIKNAKDKIKILIEIKVNGHENNIEKQVIDLINENNFSSQCVISSLDKEVLKKVKEIDSNIKTCYLGAIAYGDFYEWDYVDIYALESTFVNKNIVNKIHNSGKQIFVWTINEGELMRKMIDLNVDSIITDNPNLVNYELYTIKNISMKKVADILFD